MTIWGIALCFVFMNSRTPIKDSYSLRLSPWRRTKLDCASKRCNKECMLPAVHKREEVTILRMRGSPPRGDVHGVEGHAVISKYTQRMGLIVGVLGAVLSGWLWCPRLVWSQCLYWIRKAQYRIWSTTTRPFVPPPHPQ